MTAPCALGFVLVAGTVRGLSAVMLGDSAGALVERLRSEFPAAVVREDRDALRASVDAVLRHLGGEPSATRDLPLDVRATAFERRVWSALQQIPPGSRATYAEVAAMIGAPRSARAVARACAANRLAVVVPCHRVVPAVGGIGQYRWGAERKAGLLDSERRGGRCRRPGQPVGRQPVSRCCPPALDLSGSGMRSVAADRPPCLRPHSCHRMRVSR